MRLSLSVKGGNESATKMAEDTNVQPMIAKERPWGERRRGRHVLGGIVWGGLEPKRSYTREQQSEGGCGGKSAGRRRDI